MNDWWKLQTWNDRIADNMESTKSNEVLQRRGELNGYIRVLHLPTLYVNMRFYIGEGTHNSVIRPSESQLIPLHP